MNQAPAEVIIKRRQNIIFNVTTAANVVIQSRDCRAPKKSQNKQNQQENTMLAFNVEDNSKVYNDTEENTWILDSGASAHMTYKKEFFEELSDCHQ